MAARTKAKQEVKFTNLEKVFFPAGKFTKGDLIRYYVDVAPFILPHLKNRPVTLIRFPDGVRGEKFYEKNAPKFAPPWIKTFSVARRHEQGKINYILINDAPTLAWCANLAAIELHPFLHRVPKIEQPTFVAFDLDPGEGADILTCARVAVLVKELLDTLGLKAFPKVSGSKGIQLYVPLNTKVTYDATGAFANAVARLLEQKHPALIVSHMEKVRRQGRVLIDWSQNSRSKTTVAVYSMRGKGETPFVSMPVTWEELKRAIKSKKTASLFFTPAAEKARGSLCAGSETRTIAPQGLRGADGADGTIAETLPRKARFFQNAGTARRAHPPLGSEDRQPVRDPKTRGVAPAL